MPPSRARRTRSLTQLTQTRIFTALDHESAPQGQDPFHDGPAALPSLIGEHRVRQRLHLRPLVGTSTPRPSSASASTGSRSMKIVDENYLPVVVGVT